MPFFSIVIPTHQRPALLRRALRSLKEGGFTDYEAIVVADVCDAETFEVASQDLRPQDTFIKRTGTPGPAESRNVGLEMVRGEAVIFLDDDDTFLPGYLTRAHQAVREHPGRVVYVDCLIVEEDRLHPERGLLGSQKLAVGQMVLERVWVKNFIHNHTAIYPRAAVAGKRQDPSLSSLDDWDFLLSVLQETGFVHADIDGPVVHKDRVNPGCRRGISENARNIRVISDYLSIYKKWPAPTEDLKRERQALLAGAGFKPPLEWL
jgi:glycosyltransferase involved in cell wall biosynthesis